MLECEYFENGPKENVSFIPQHKMRNGTVEVEIENTKMYKFRLVVDNASGEPHKSDWIEVKPPASGTKFAYDPSASCRFMSAVSKNVMYVPAPTTLRKQSETSEGNVMISWNYIGKDEATFLLEGSCSSECTDWKVIFSGKTTKYLICDKSLVTFRVKALVKDKLSAYSEVLFVQRCTFNGKKSMSCLKIEKSARPHFNEKRKPDVCSLPKIKNITSNSVVIRWQIKNLLDETNDVASPTFSQLSSPQISNSLFYELQRVDSSPLIIYSGDASEFKYEDLKPLEHIQIRARAVTIDNDGNRSEGDWSSIASCCTLSPLPLPPQNLRLQNVSSLRLRNSKLIIWNEPADGSVILEYKIYSYHHEADDNNFKGTLIEISSTPDTNYLLENIVGNNKYVFSVTAVTKAGESEKCDAVCFVSDTLLPSMPTNFDKCEVGTKNITMVWGSPASNGDSVTNYCLDVIEKTGRIEYKEGVPIEDNQLVASIILDHKTFKANIGELKPLTEYIVKLHATSREGKGGEIEKIVKTLQEPPSPPSLTLLGTTFCGLRIKINSVEEVHYYCVEQEREEGGFMKVYSGEGSSIKIKHLKEHTYYNFRVCSAFNCGQACSEYSEIYSFQTGRTAPAAIKKVPLIHEHSPTNYTIEWPAVVASPGLYKDDIVGELKYRVEMTSKFGNEKPLEGWKTIYEDTHNSFNYLLEPGFQIAGKQVRVITIRNIDGNQYYSLPSTVAYFKNCVHQPLESPKKLAGENNGTVEGVVSKISKAKADEQAKFIKNLIKGKKNNGSISFYFKKGCAYFSFPFVITVVSNSSLGINFTCLFQIICALIAFLFTMVGRFLY
uniref:Fibronectin type-III domain-containing protein n=1 Tax=Rhabditophanes sp. KR3021 TaxID=114890 RepID=A0AC35TWF5_9BILA